MTVSAHEWCFFVLFVYFFVVVFGGPAGILTQDLLNTSQTLLPLSQAQAEFQLILTLSELDWTETLAELCNLLNAQLWHIVLLAVLCHIQGWMLFTGDDSNNQLEFGWSL